MPFGNAQPEYINQSDSFSIYLDIAGKVVAKTGKRRGTCLELASGPGYLGFALALLTKMEVYLLENSPTRQKLAVTNIDSYHLEDRVRILKGRITKIPLADGTVDLIVSQQSLIHWNDMRRTFEEIQRVLAPGGIACVGSGRGWGDIKDLGGPKSLDSNPKLRLQPSTRFWMNQAEQLEAELGKAGISSYEVNFDDECIWVLIRNNPANGFLPTGNA